MTAERSKAADTLMRSDLGQTEIARAVGRSVVTVHHWIQGAKKPSPENRDKLAELSESWSCGRIEPSWWDESIAPRSESKPAPDATAPLPLPNDLAGQLKYLEGRAAHLARLSETAATPEKQIRSLSLLTRVYSDIATIRARQNRAFIEHPLCKALMKRLSEALTPHPAGARAVKDLFERLERDGGL